MAMKSSPTSGVKPMSLAGRFVSERERLIGMTEEERAWRAQWVKDQILSPNEPRHVPEMYKQLVNPIRRVYRYPLDALARVVEPRFGSTKTAFLRYVTGKMFMSIYATYITFYYFKYYGNDWTRTKGWRVNMSRVAVLDGDPGYPQVSEKSRPDEYFTRGFDKVTLKFD